MEPATTFVLGTDGTAEPRFRVRWTAPSAVLVTARAAAGQPAADAATPLLEAPAAADADAA